MRKRQRDNAGFSPNSWKKHRLMRCAAQGQAYAYRHTHPTTRCLIVDMHAGSGEGIEMPQLDFFETKRSFASATLAVQLASALGNSEVILCELLRRERQLLAQRFPGVTILPDHTEVPNLIRPTHQWALVLNDPCGYASHGITTMETIASLVKTDWIVAFNEGGLYRLLSMEPHVEGTENPFVASVRQARTKYAWMAEPRAWAQRLGARHMAQSRLIPGSAAFRYRMLVLSHTLSQTLRPPTWEHVV